MASGTPRVPEAWEWERIKRCAGCGKQKPWAEFPADRVESGRLVFVKSRCRQCASDDKRAARALQRTWHKPQMGRGRVPQPWEWVKTKECPRCNLTKPWAKFSPQSYWPDGSVRCVQAYCKDCRNETQRAGPPRQITPERLAYITAWHRRRRAELRRERTERGRHLELQPLKAWLLRVRDEEGSLISLAQDAGLHPDTLGKVLTEDKHGNPIKTSVSFRMAEAALCARGLRLTDIYPDAQEAA